MKTLKGLSVVVVGAGVMGSVVALRLIESGAQVTIADKAAIGDNASGVAAGMLAPVFESLLDPVSNGHYPWLRAGRDAWPALAASIGLGRALDRSGALFVPSSEPALEALQAAASRLDLRLDLVPPADAAALAPGLAPASPALFTGEDWRLSPRPMLRALRATYLGRGGTFAESMVRAVETGRVWLEDGGRLKADAVILAVGAAPVAWAPAPELSRMTPIKGQILRFAALNGSMGATVRGEGFYAAPSADGLRVGATMEPGLNDRTVDLQSLAPMRTLASRLFPALVGAEAVAEVGVRSASPDSLPVVGPSASGSVMLAMGARRNGWLLAPLAAEILLAHLAGADPGPWGRVFDPQRLAVASR